jgi:Bacterial protein of unknown function (DUF839)
MHGRADGGAVFAKEDGSGFYYASNSELGEYDAETGVVDGAGGVYVFELDNAHRPVDFYPVLKGTVDNCAGGSTPWGTWVSCEEEHGYGKYVKELVFWGLFSPSWCVAAGKPILPTRIRLVQQSLK